MKIVSTPNAPQAIGPYSQAIDLDGCVFLSGQIPLDPETMQLVGDDISSQTEQIFKNIRAVLEAAGLTLSNVAKTTVFLKDMNDFSEMNKVYESNFGTHKPARSAVEVARLPKDCMIEIECIATRS